MQESNRNIVIDFIDNQNINQKDIPKALKELNIIPSSKSWYNFIDRLLLYSGALSLTFAVLFFVAYNWSELNRFGKFTLVEGLLIATMGIYLYLKENELISKVLLVVLSILVGTLLALVGQTYQTGADSWELFFYWALFILPWVFISRFWAMWIFWIGLIDISITLYQNRILDFSPIEILFMLNSLALVAWEYLKHHFKWLDNFWAIRLLGIISMITITKLTTDSVMLLPIGIVWIAIFYYLYRVKQIDIFMLSLGFVGLSIVVLYYLINSVSWIHFNLVYILFIAMVTIGLGMGFISWLKSIQKEVLDETNR